MFGTWRCPRSSDDLEAAVGGVGIGGAAWQARGVFVAHGVERAEAMFGSVSFYFEVVGMASHFGRSHRTISFSGCSSWKHCSMCYGPALSLFRGVCLAVLGGLPEGLFSFEFFLTFDAVAGPG